MLFRRFLFQLAHLLLDALQHRVRANGSLDYAFRRLSDAFLNFGFLGSHIADRMLSMGHKVVGVDNFLGGYEDNVHEAVEFQRRACVPRRQLGSPSTHPLSPFPFLHAPGVGACAPHRRNRKTNRKRAKNARQQAPKEKEEPKKINKKYP